MTRQEINDFGVKISQASRSGLIVIMYEMAIKYIDDGVAVLDKGNTEEFGKNIKRAKSVVNELASVLNMKYEISYELRRLYVFMISVLVKADIRKETDELLRVRDMLVELKNAFTAVCDNDNSGPMMQNTEQVYAGLTYSRSSLNENVYSNINRGYKV